MSRITYCASLCCLFTFFIVTSAQNVERIYDNSASDFSINISTDSSDNIETTTKQTRQNVLRNNFTKSKEISDPLKQTETSQNLAFKFKDKTIKPIEVIFLQDDNETSIGEFAKKNDSYDEMLRELDENDSTERIEVDAGDVSTPETSGEVLTKRDSRGDGRKLSHSNNEGTLKLFLESRGIDILNESDVYNLSPKFITESEIFIKHLENKESSDKSILTKLIEKKYNTQTKIIPLNERNNNNGTARQDKRENYGVSVVISSDILALKSVVESFEPSLCKNESLQLLESLLSGKLWALKMYDACAKSPTGLLSGNTFQLGNFDECLEVGMEDDSPVKGQYCVANIELLKNTLPTTKYGKRFGPREDIHWAVCVPSSCPSYVVERFVTTLLLRSSGGGNVHVPPTNCHIKEPLKIDKYDVIFASVIGAFAVFLIACTVFHVYLRYTSINGYKRTETVLIEAILSFSIARSLNKIFSVKKHNELGLDALAGIKVFSMVVILCGHALMFILSGPVTNTAFYDDMLARAENAIILANPLLVDSFLLISAFLFCRLMLLELDKRKGKFNVLPIYMFRYLRVTPSYFVVIALYMTWLDKLNQGPLWDSKMALEKERCIQSWWTNILYINNYVNTDHLCMFQSWYLSVDTQLFFLAPGIIYPLWRWPKIGQWLLGTMTTIVTVIPFVVTYWNRYDATILPYPKEVTDITQNYYFKEAYIKTHMRSTAYCIGLLSGYILHRVQSSGYKFKSNTLWTCWILAAIFGMSSVFSVTFFFQPDYVYNPLTAAIYSALHRVAWATANGWLLIACSTKNFGPFDKLFLWKPLIPLSRLTYCAYLVNGLVELHGYGTLQNSIHLSVFNLTTICASHVLQTFVGALVLCVMFESPIHGFERILLKAIVNSPKRNPGDSKENLEESEAKQ